MTPLEIINLLPDAEAETLTALLRRDASVDKLLNSLVRMAVALAIAAEVEPKRFSEGVSETWREIASQANAKTPFEGFKQ